MVELSIKTKKEQMFNKNVSKDLERKMTKAKGDSIKANQEYERGRKVLEKELKNLQKKLPKI
jgi:hypothetical protein